VNNENIEKKVELENVIIINEKENHENDKNENDDSEKNEVVEIYNKNNDIYDIIHEKSILDIRFIEKLVNDLRLKIKKLDLIALDHTKEICDLKEIIRLEPEIAQKGIDL
jgi:hypothetical protein